MGKRIDYKYSCGQCAMKFTLHLSKEKCDPCPDGCKYCSVISAKNGQNLSGIIDSSKVHEMVLKMEPSDTSIICNCKEAEIYLPDSKKCKSCSLNCESCYYGTIGRMEALLIVCRRCSIGYTLVNNKCLKNCDVGYYRDTREICKPCLEGCIRCTTSRCLECPKGKQFADDVRKCVDCGNASKGCQKCFLKVMGYNLTHVRQYKDYGLFEYEDKPVLICSDEITTVCKPQDVFFLGTANCVRCIQNCAKCGVSFNKYFSVITKCQMCKKGFRLSPIFGVMQCVPICPLGQGFLNIKGSCQKCPENCVYCVDSSLINKNTKDSFLECLKCQPGTFLNIDRKSCISCSNPPFNYFCGRCVLTIKKDDKKIYISDFLEKYPVISQKIRDEQSLITRECYSNFCPLMFYRKMFSCIRCSNNCRQCKFENGKEICLDKYCDKGFIKSKKGDCHDIRKIKPEERKNICSSGYVLRGIECVKCPPNCDKCFVDVKNPNIIRCSHCALKFTITANGRNCSLCNLKDKNCFKCSTIEKKNGKDFNVTKNVLDNKQYNNILGSGVSVICEKKCPINGDYSKLKGKIIFFLYKIKINKKFVLLNFFIQETCFCPKFTTLNAAKNECVKCGKGCDKCYLFADKGSVNITKEIFDNNKIYTNEELSALGKIAPRCQNCAKGYVHHYNTSSSYGCVSCGIENCNRCSFLTIIDSKIFLLNSETHKKGTVYAKKPELFCQECQKNYFLNYTKKSCTLCKYSCPSRICYQQSTDKNLLNYTKLISASDTTFVNSTDYSYKLKTKIDLLCDAVKCLKGYILNKEKNSCLKCPDNCTDCRVNSIDAAECYECNQGYAFNFISRMCVSCGTISRDCKECFYVNHYKDSRKLNLNIWNRLNKPIPEKEKVTQTKFQCSTDFSAKVCREGETFSMLALLCVKCPAYCDSTKKCTINYKESRIDCICKEGEHYDYVRKICNKGCAPKYYLNNKKCSPCPATCKTCKLISGEMKCTSCFYGHYLHHDLKECRICPLNAIKSSCTMCYIKERTGKKENITLALEKNIKDNTAPTKRVELNMEIICTQNECPKNMQWNDKFKTCEILPCPSICKECTATHRCKYECATCKKCYVKEELTFQEIGFLKEKQVELKKYCHSCDTAQVLSLDGYKCLPCPSNCHKCSYGYYIGGIFINVTKILTAKRFFLGKSQSTIAKLKCEACAEGHTYNPGFRVCTKCPQNCIACDPGKTEQIVCKVCDKNFVIGKDGSCKPFPKGCLYTTRENQCGLCSKNYILKEGKCKLCQEGCESCLSISKETNKPIFFDFFYKEIENVYEICTSCYLGFYMDRGVCKKCPKGCSHCVLEKNRKKTNCHSCFPNYKMHGKEGHCKRCPHDCDSCYDNKDKRFIENKELFDYSKKNCENCKNKNSFIAYKNSQKICVSSGKDCKKITNCVECKRNFIGIQTQRILTPDYYYGIIFTRINEIKEIQKNSKAKFNYDINLIERYMRSTIPDSTRLREIKTAMKIFEKISSKFVYEEKYVEKRTLINSRINEVCLKCEPGFNIRLNTGQCDKCVKECTNCILDEKQQYQCKACIESYYLDNNQCKNCPKGCSKCEKIGSQVNCKTICKSNQIFNPIISKCIECKKDCKDRKCYYSPIFYISYYKYQISDKEGYKYPLPPVKTSDKCILCLKEGYYYEKKVKGCLKCLGNCKTCLNKYTCTACDNDNYQLKHGKCYLNSCKKGEFNDGKGCKPCKSPCSLCVDKEDKCTKCQDKNHVLIDNKCQGNYNKLMYFYSLKIREKSRMNSRTRKQVI